MNKKFLEVFPYLKLNKDTVNLLDNIEVEKVICNRDRSKFDVYITSTVLIARNIIEALEDELSSDLLHHKKLPSIRIIDSYVLSKQYTPQYLWQTYKNSFIQEIKNKDQLLARCLERAQLSFDEKKVRVVVENEIIYKSKENEIIRTVENLFNKKFGYSIEVLIEYAKNNLSEEEKRIEEEKQYEISSIIRSINENSVNKNLEEEKSTEESNKRVDYQNKTTDRINNDSWKSKNYNGYKRKKKTLGSDEGQIYGPNFEGEAVPISAVEGTRGEIVIEGQIRNTEERELRTGSILYIFDVTDFTDTITVKIFLSKEEMDELRPELSAKKFIQVCGVTSVDAFSGELVLLKPKAIRQGHDIKKRRVDTSLEKRVELHMHTNMSENDAIAPVSDLIDAAVDFGMNAMAITDHGVVNAFTDAFHHINDLKKSLKNKSVEELTDREKLIKNFKIIYGMEGYVVDDIQRIVTGATDKNIDGEFVVFDLETTGFGPKVNKIIEIGAVKIKAGQVIDKFNEFVNPQIPIPYNITQLTSIKDSDVENENTIEDVLPRFIEFCGNAVLVAHNASFDVGFILQNCENLKIDYHPVYLDTLMLSEILLPSLRKHNLDALSKELKIKLDNHHNAVDDAKCTAEIFLNFIGKLRGKGITSLKDINGLASKSTNSIKRLRRNHIVLLAKNEVGRVNLYRLISMSNLEYFHKRPQIPKSKLQEYRQGLIIGSACEAGELYRALVENRTEERISELCDFYDYFEIQPVSNNEFMIDSGKYPNINSIDDITNINKKIVELGEKYDKPVVATCDAHFLNPQDDIYRKILLTAKDYKDADNQAPLYFRTTNEMMDEFSYLDEAKRKEVVITNTKKIADMIEYIEPVRPDKCPPVIENSDQDLRDICYNRAKEWYGENIPEIVKTRLDIELNSIIDNGYSVMYIIAQKLVKFSNDNGYLVGSRGSVGSSFAATMAGITEVNPLGPHYRCMECKYSDFDSDIVKEYTKNNTCGCDLPDKVCPVCGKPLIKDGFNIPFETFLGFSANKEPDIDLNFSGDFQTEAHKYTEVIFGKGQTFKAGTVGTIAEKTAYGYVKSYFEKHGARKRSSEIDRLKDGLVGIKRTTGQHPGGIIVLPHGEEIHSFTPIQHPANDESKGVITTHFDYHSIDHNLLKLDILGHDDPTMIRFLEDMTGVDATTIPLDDKKVMSLFESTKALGIEPKDIHGCKLGCLGVPEFGTENTIRMVMDVKPKTFSDLVRISGLSHGTDVWNNNAQDLIKNGTADISTVISTRDDIMVYLINHGLEKSDAFDIMEDVRKGKIAEGKPVRAPQWKEKMEEHEIPNWYINSCKKIKYMFPKAHAAAYVMMGFRIAWYKINYPKEYYAAFFGIRAKAFKYGAMCHGKEEVEKEYSRISSLIEKRKETPNDKAIFQDLKIVEEMYARGIEFMPIDIYKAKAKTFQIIDGKIMPSLTAIDGLGEAVADAIENEAKKGVFLSQQDLKKRTGLSGTILEYMIKEGILSNMQETNQISIFD